MRRRRRSNKTLAKTMLIAFGIVLLMLPILGYLGAFKAIKDQYTQAVEVELPPPPPEPKEAKAHKTHPHVAHHGEVHLAGSSRPLPIHVAAAVPTPGANTDDDNTVVNGNNTNLGQVPVAPATSAPVAPPIAAPVAPPATQPVAPPAAPIVTAPAEPDVVEATPIPDTQVKPVIPDDLRDSYLDTTFRAQFTVHPDGNADVTMVDSTGNNELDQLALQAARQWRFQPATKDGQPILSYRRLEVDFEVS
jgi:periplasmic protein TonB